MMYLGHAMNILSDSFGWLPSQLTCGGNADDSKLHASLEVQCLHVFGLYI